MPYHQSNKKKKNYNNKNNKKQSRDTNNNHSNSMVSLDIDNLSLEEKENGGETTQKNEQLSEKGLDGNKKSDKPYRVAISDVMGRYLVANRDLKAGELIIEIQPLVVGPCADCQPVCLGCHIDIPKCVRKQYKCPNCGWPLCGPKCRGIKKQLGHSAYECTALREHRVADFLVDNTDKEISQMYEAILVLRCLLLREHRADTWDKLIEMEAHNNIRRDLPALWNRNQNVIVDRIIQKWGFGEYSIEDVHTVCGILEVNSFEVGRVGKRARALFPEAFLISHDCCPNTTHTDHPRQYTIAIRMTKDLKEGEMISLSYSYTLMGTLKRRQHLMESKFFWCTCQRCADPTELGTYASALRCPKCTSGYILSTNPLDQQAQWKCEKCGYCVTGKHVLTLADRLFDEMDSQDPNDVLSFERFLEKYRNVLHKNHYLNLSVKHSLCELYGRTEEYLLNTMSPEELKRKEDYCRDLMEVIDVLEPGLSRLRGVVMYELHAPVMLQTTRLFEEKRITTTELKRRLREVIKLLKDSALILGFEPEGTPEADMGMAAKDALARMGNV